MMRKIMETRSLHSKMIVQSCVTSEPELCREGLRMIVLASCYGHFLFPRLSHNVYTSDSMQTGPTILTSVMFLNDVHHLSLREIDLVRVLAMVVSQHRILFQILHLVWVRDDCLCGCCRGRERGGGRGRGREREREMEGEEERDGGQIEREGGRMEVCRRREIRREEKGQK